MNLYETMFVLNPELEEGTIKDIIEKVSDIIKTDGNVIKVDEWGKRQLAYEIDKKYREGYYILLDFEANPVILDELNHTFKVNENIIRDIVIRK